MSVAYYFITQGDDIMKAAKKKKNGFTLVELIVVLVILAILAAILVPALLGYIDRAKNQQIVLNARSCMTAAQAELSSMYGKNATGFDGTNATAVPIGQYVDASDSEEAKRIMDTADVPNCTWLAIGCDEGMKAGSRKGYIITFVYYQEGSKGVYYDGKTWNTVDGFPTEARADKVTYYIKSTH
jgi:prepilin-type N-terminal cleavage/methylation domain-containing protein